MKEIIGIILIIPFTLIVLFAIPLILIGFPAWLILKKNREWEDIFLGIASVCFYLWFIGWFLIKN